MGRYESFPEETQFQRVMLEKTVEPQKNTDGHGNGNMR
jgi:hypothetical protein